MDNRNGRLYLGLVIAAIGLLTLLAKLSNLSNLGDLMGAVFLWAVAAGLLFGYERRRAVGLLIAGAVVGAIGTFVLLQSLGVVSSGAGWGWLFFALIALAFFVVFLAEHRTQRWAIPAALGTLAFAAFVFSTEYPRVGTIIFPILLVLFGLWVVFRPRLS
ncbi:MAG: hypothetical protein ACYC6V_06890 [Bacillota bacterium]